MSEILLAIVSFFLISCSTLHQPVDSVNGKSAIVARDRRFVQYASGVVADMNTGLEWFVGPDQETRWHEAHHWVANLKIDGGGWRMPTALEVDSIRLEGNGKQHLTPLLKTTGTYVWTGQKKGPNSNDHILYTLTYGHWSPRSFSYFASRGFAVRQQKTRPKKLLIDDSFL